jgi:hypothetical protein
MLVTASLPFSDAQPSITTILRTTSVRPNCGKLPPQGRYGKFLKETTAMPTRQRLADREIPARNGGDDRPVPRKRIIKAA